MQNDPLIGQNLGNYHIERLLGRGGMAQVYYGWDINLERPVAIKVIDVRYRESLAYAARFLREARTVAAWHHENIIQIYYCSGEQEELHYFVMAYIEGMDLQELITAYARQGELMPYEDILAVGRSVASALDYAHSKDVIHRDVKPSNIMIAGDGRIVLMDFGLAMDMAQGSIGEVVGSPHYLAPEQARSSAAAVAQSDLYSLGVILYELLTGAVPFDDPSSTTVAVQHITQAPPLPRELNPTLSPETEAVLLKALSKEPEERYATGAALVAALAETLADAQVQEAPQTYLLAPESDEQAATSPQVSAVSLLDRVTHHLENNAASLTTRPQYKNPQDSDLVGQQLGDFQLDALLGRGGMARVYRGTESPLNRQVAIKVIDAPFRADPEYLMRFEREAQAIAKLEHPHIVRLYRYGKEHGMLYMAMQYVDGADLASVLRSYREENEFIEIEHIQRIVHEMCEALDYAHTQGIIHRDVKPANIMITPQDHAILMDFGLALLTETGTRGTIFGSPHYIAPEQAVSSASVVPQSDLYAIGVILYEMFTGQPPFDADDPLEIAMLHISDEPRPPHELRPDILPTVEAVILKALAKEPAERFSTGQALATAVEQALQAIPHAADLEHSSLYAKATLLRSPQITYTTSSATTTPSTAAKATTPAITTPSASIPAPPPTMPQTAEEHEPEAAAPTADSPTPPPVATSPVTTTITATTTTTAMPVETSTTTTTTLTETMPEAMPPAAKAPTAAPPTATSPAPPPSATTIPAQVPTPISPSPAATTTTTSTIPVPPQTASPQVATPAAAEMAPPPQADSVAQPATASAPPPQRNMKWLVGGAVFIGLIMIVACLAVGGTLLWKIAQRPEATQTPILLTTDVPSVPATATSSTATEPTAKAEVPTQATKTSTTSSTATPVPATAMPVATTTTAPTAIPIPDLTSYEFVIALKGDENLFVVNQSPNALPLTPLSITSEKGNIPSEIWDIVALQPGECVAWGRESDDIKFPDGVECTLIKHYPGDYEGKAFWGETNFDIRYGDIFASSCKKKGTLCPLYFVSGAVELPQNYKLVIQYHGKDGISIKNQNDDGLPITFLRLSNSKGTVTGGDWNVDRLEPGYCVVAWKDDKEPKDAKDLDCIQVAAQLNFERGQRFWESKFTIAYGNETLGECEEKDKTCVFQRGFDENDDDDDD